MVQHRFVDVHRCRRRLHYRAVQQRKPSLVVVASVPPDWAKESHGQWATMAGEEGVESVEAGRFFALPQKAELAMVADSGRLSKLGKNAMRSSATRLLHARNDPYAGLLQECC